MKKLAEITIDNGETLASGHIKGDALKPYRRAKICAPAALTGTVALKTNRDADPDMTDTNDLVDEYSGGSKVTIPANGAVTVDCIDVGFWTLESDGAEGAARTFVVWGTDPV